MADTYGMRGWDAKSLYDMMMYRTLHDNTVLYKCLAASCGYRLQGNTLAFDFTPEAEQWYWLASGAFNRLYLDRLISSICRPATVALHMQGQTGPDVLSMGEAKPI